MASHAARLPHAQVVLPCGALREAGMVGQPAGSVNPFAHSVRDPPRLSRTRSTSFAALLLPVRPNNSEHF